MRRLLLTALLFALIGPAAAQRTIKEPRVRFGVGYRFSLPLREHRGVKAGPVKEGAWDSPDYARGGELVLEGTVRIDKNWNTGLGVTYGRYDREWATFKVYAKAERLYGKRPSRWFNYANLGTSLFPDNAAGFTAGLGGGYRLAMTRRTRLDFTVGIDYLNLVGRAYNRDTDEVYPRGAHNNRIGLAFGIAMHF